MLEISKWSEKKKKHFLKLHVEMANVSKMLTMNISEVNVSKSQWGISEFNKIIHLLFTLTLAQVYKYVND